MKICKVVNSCLGECYSPNTFKRIDYGSLVGGVVGAALNFASQENANMSNEKINREQLRWQTAENETSRAWQNIQNRKAEDFERETWEYNTPENQRKRLEQAGYNPWMSGSGSPQNVASGQGHSNGAAIGSAPSMIPMQAPQFNIGAVADLMMAKANVANQNAKTLSEYNSAYTEMLKNGVPKKTADAWYRGSLKSIGIADKEVDSLIMGVNENLRKIQQENDYQQTKNEIYDVYGAKEARMHLENLKFANEKLDSEISLLKSEKNLTDENVKKAVEETAKILEEKLTIKETREFIKRKLEAEAKILENDPMANGTFAAMEKGMPILAKFLNLLLKVIK